MFRCLNLAHLANILFNEQVQFISRVNLGNMDCLQMLPLIMM